MIETACVMSMPAFSLEDRATQQQGQDQEKGNNEMQFTTVESAVIPAGSYKAGVVSITEQDGDYGSQLRWQFGVISPEEYAGHRLVSWTSTSPSTKSRLVKWMGACLGRQIGAGETLSTKNAIGRRVEVNVVVQQGTDGIEFNRVDDLWPCDPGLAADLDDGIDDPFGDE